MQKVFFLLIIFSFLSCRQKSQEPKTAPEYIENISETDEVPKVKKELSQLVPDNFIIFGEIYGDLNKDGLEDCILIIKDTKKEKIIEHEYRGTLDQNRRGIIIALNKGNHYEPIVQNYSCFSSENEDGGVYYAPELYIEINAKGNMEILYLHGRYGRWGYMFRYQNNTFEMIGAFSESNRGPIGLSKESINFSTRKREISINTNGVYGDDEMEEKWEDIWEDINDKALIKLNDIEDFDEISFDSYFISQAN